jgi:drug/metabolite transporter (DMT)-like permease
LELPELDTPGEPTERLKVILSNVKKQGCLSDRAKALLYFNTYICLMQTYAVIVKFIMRPGGFDGRDMETFRGVDPVEMSCFRTMFNCTVSFFIMKFGYGKSLSQFPKHYFKFMMMRCFCGVTGFVSGTYSISFVPITVYSVLLNTSPFHVNVLSYFFLNETLKKRDFIGMFLCFIGVVIFVNGKAS